MCPASTRSTSEPRLAVDSAGERFLRFVASGDRENLEELVAEFLDRAYSQARHLLGHTQDAEDAVQDAFFRLMRNASRFDGSIPFVAWLSRFVHAAAVDLLRTGRHRRERETRAARRAEIDQRECDEAATEAETILAVVRQLPERYRAPIDLHYFGGLSQGDTAKALGMNESAVSVRLHRARECLRSLLKRRGVVVAGAAIVLSLASATVQAAPVNLRTTIVRTLTSASRSGSLFSGAAGAKWSLWYLLASAVAVAAVIAIVSSFVFSRTPAGGSPGPAETRATAADGKPFRVAWDFSTEPVEPLAVYGNLEWVPAEGGAKPGMSAMRLFGAPSQSAMFPIPVELPDKPLVVTIEQHGLEAGNVAQFFGWAKLGGPNARSTESRGWRTRSALLSSTMKTDRFVAYVTREVIVCRLNGQLLTVTLYERNRPPDQLAVSIPDGIVVESIEVHEAAPGEIPESDRSPSRLTADMIANSPTNMAFTPTY